MKYPILIEKGERNYSAFSPDVPGCCATGRTLEEVRREIAAALTFHFEGTLEDGDPIPPVTCIAEMVEVEIPVRAAVPA